MPKFKIRCRTNRRHSKRKEPPFLWGLLGALGGALGSLGGAAAGAAGGALGAAGGALGSVGGALGGAAGSIGGALGSAGGAIGGALQQAGPLLGMMGGGGGGGGAPANPQQMILPSQTGGMRFGPNLTSQFRAPPQIPAQPSVSQGLSSRLGQFGKDYLQNSLSQQGGSDSEPTQAAPYPRPPLPPFQNVPPPPQVAGASPWIGGKGEGEGSVQPWWWYLRKGAS